MGLLAAVADLSLYRFSHRLGGQAVAQLSLACQLLNWFTLFAAARTLINSLEWALTTLALAHFTALPAPMDNAALRARHEWRFLFIVSVCVLLRPTAAVQVSCYFMSNFFSDGMLPVIAAVFFEILRPVQLVLFLLGDRSQVSDK